MYLCRSANAVQLHHFKTVLFSRCGGLLREMSSQPVISERITLSDGNQIPVFGFGCYKLTDHNQVEAAISTALSQGYRLFDTAAYYGNEKLIGEALKSSGISRSDYFVVTKLWHTAHGYNETKNAVMKSLEELGMDYIDLYLIHGPAAGKNIESWKAILDMKRNGVIRSAGVSNFNIHHIKPIKDMQLEMPVVNQIEIHPLLQQKEIVQYCHANNINVMAYCPLARFAALNQDQGLVLDSICDRVQRSRAQVFLKWSMQRNFIPIPKASQPRHVEENAQLSFTLSDADMSRLDKMDCNLRVSTDSILSPWVG